jgi:phosphonate transport system substrate-binding protein
MKGLVSRRPLTGALALALMIRVGGAAAADHADAPANPQLASRDQTIVVGVISADPKKQLPKLEALAGYLAERTKGQGISAGAAIVARDNEEMIRLLRRGAVDIVSETAFTAIHLSTEAGAQILMREWKKGAAEYRTVIIARRGAGIDSLRDLRGRMLAFEDPGSTTGFLLPLALLRQNGINALQMPIGSAPERHTVGYAFAVEEINIATMVSRGIVDAGAISNLDWEDFTRTPEAMRDGLVIVHQSGPLLRSTLLVRKDLPAGLKARLRDVLMAMDEDPAGQAVLQQYYKVAKYDAIAGAAAESLESVRQLYPLVAPEIR